MNMDVKQLQRMKEDKLKSMSMDEVKVYIERNVAYYYSHYSDFKLIFDMPSDERDSYNDEAVMFQDSFNRNMEVIIDGIRDDYQLDGNERQLKINYVLCVLFSCLNDNLLFNHEKEHEYVSKMCEGLMCELEFKDNLYAVVTGFVTVTDKAYNLLFHCKRLLLSLYSLVVVNDVSDDIFSQVNLCFKQLFLDFFMNYCCSKSYDIQNLLDENCKSGDVSVDDVIESDRMRELYENTVEKLKDIDDEFNELMKDGDLFSYPKSVLSDSVLDDAVVYDLKRFDIYYPVDNYILNEWFDSDEVSDEYNQLLSMMNRFDVSIFEDNSLDGDDVSVDDPSGTTIVPDVDVSEENVEYLEEMLL